MTDEQFEKFLAIQAAQLAMLQNISRNIQSVVIGKQQVASHNWEDVAKDIKNALATVRKL